MSEYTFGDEDMQYLYKKLLRLQKEFRDFEKLVYRWKQKDDKVIDELKKELGNE